LSILGELLNPDELFALVRDSSRLVSLGRSIKAGFDSNNDGQHEKNHPVHKAQVANQHCPRFVVLVRRGGTQEEGGSCCHRRLSEMRKEGLEV